MNCAIGRYLAIGGLLGMTSGRIAQRQIVAYKSPDPEIGVYCIVRKWWNPIRRCTN